MPFLIFFLLAGCAVTNPWRLESIPGEEALFDSARLSYHPSENLSPLRLELLRSEKEISSFLSLTQFWFHSASSTVLARFLFGDEEIETPLTLLEGNMKLSLPPPITQKLLFSLQRGQSVHISVDGFEMALSPEHFLKTYDRWMKKNPFSQNLFKSFA